MESLEEEALFLLVSFLVDYFNSSASIELQYFQSGNGFRAWKFKISYLTAFVSICTTIYFLNLTIHILSRHSAI